MAVLQVINQGGLLGGIAVIRTIDDGDVNWAVSMKMEKLSGMIRRLNTYFRD